MKKETKGLCILAGAGPGDIGLVTLRAREAVEQAEVVVYDYLCNPEILKWAPAGAEIVFAGKKSGQHSLPQESTSWPSTCSTTSTPLPGVTQRQRKRLLPMLF